MGINNRNYNSSGMVNTPKLDKQTSSSSTGLNLAKVFAYMFSALIITAAIAVAVGFGWRSWLQSADRSNVVGKINAILAVSGFLTIITTLIMNFVCLKQGKGVKIMFYIFAALMGVTLSTLTIYTEELPIVGIAFGMTSAVFALMWLVAFIGKDKLNPLATVGITVLLGAGLVALITWIITLFTRNVNNTVIWVLDFIIFGAIMLITIVDIARIQKIAAQGEMYDDLAVFCACTLYVDFIYILVRIATWLIIAYANNR